MVSAWFIEWLVCGWYGRCAVYTDRHSIQTNQCPLPPSPHVLQTGCPSCLPANSINAMKAMNYRLFVPIPKTFRSQERKVPMETFCSGAFCVPANFRFQDLSLKVLRNFRSRALSFLGTFVPIFACTVFSERERELKFTFAICCRPSVCRLSVCRR